MEDSTSRLLRWLGTSQEEVSREKGMGTAVDWSVAPYNSYIES